MSELKKEKIDVKNLELGMFVVELDRPWIESPFLLQGFVLEEQAELDKMREICMHVYIDRTKSIGSHFAAAAKRQVAIKREGTVIRVKAPTDKLPPSIKKAQQGEKVTFMDIVRDLKNHKKIENTPTATSNDAVMFNVRHGADTIAQANVADTPNNRETQHSSVTKQLVGDVGNLLAGMVSGLFRGEKLRTSVKGASKYEKNKVEDDHKPYKTTIYHEESPPVENEIAKIYPAYEQSQIATRDIFTAVAAEQEIDLGAVSEVLDSMVESIGRTPDALMWLAKLKQTDDHAYNHALNVSINLMAFGNFLAFSKKQIKELGLAGLLQDIGKAKLSPDVLLKDGSLTREEYEYAKKHVDETLKILENTNDMDLAVLEIVAQHHERADGSGYPNKLDSSMLSLPSQAAGLIDTYCAITSHRCYAKSLYHHQALDEIHSLSGQQFSELLVDQFVQFMGMYPVSSLVALNTGEVGVVIQQNLVRRLQPRVMLILDSAKKRYDAPVVIDLLNNPVSPYGEIYSISKSLPPSSYGLNPNDFFA